MTTEVTSFPEAYRYKAIAESPHHVMSIENGRMFFVGCFDREDEAIARLRNGPGGYLMQSGRVKGLARYRDGKLVETVFSDAG